MLRTPAALLIWLSAGLPLAAQSCDLRFVVDVTQGVPTHPPGSRLEGRASFTTLGPRIRQEGGATAHLAAGEMVLEGGIAGPIWTLIVTSNGSAADLIGLYANHVSGLSVAGVDFAGPMVLTLYGRPGARPEPDPPVSQADWDRLDLRRAFSLQAPEGRDMLAGDVSELKVSCD
ncbi:MAG: hypothetical protein ACOCTP_03250 [Roseicyclus sp.]